MSNLPEILIEVYYTKNSDNIKNEYYLPLIPKDPSNKDKVELQYIKLPIYNTDNDIQVGHNTWFRTVGFTEMMLGIDTNLVAVNSLNTPYGDLMYVLTRNNFDIKNNTIPTNKLYKFIPTYKSDKYLMYNDIQISIEIFEDIRVITIVSKK